MDTSLTYYLVIQVKTLSFVKLVILSNSYASQFWKKNSIFTIKLENMRLYYELLC